MLEAVGGRRPYGGVESPPAVDLPESCRKRTSREESATCPSPFSGVYVEAEGIWIMALPRSELPQGTLDMLILRVVALGPIHGYAIAQRIRQISRDALQVMQGSL